MQSRSPDRWRSRKADHSESLAKAVLSAARLAEKMGWMSTVVRASDSKLIVAIKL